MVELRFEAVFKGGVMAFKAWVRLAGGLSALVMALAGAPSVQASGVGSPPVINWTINGLFSDGGIFNGTFTYDGATDTVYNWHVTTTTPQSDPLYAPGLGSVQISDFPPGVGFSTAVDPFTTEFFQLFMPLSTPGTFSDLWGNEAAQIDLGSIAFVYIVHFVDSGTAVGVLESAIPEPATWSMMIVGFGMAGGLLRRRRRILAA
jgi:hypothetical protein